jgi:type II secretory pathway component PulM
MMQPGGLQSRMVFLAGLVGLAVLVWAGLVAPAMEWRAGLARQLADTRAETARLNLSLGDLRQERSALTLGGTEGLVWSAPKLGEATALVQGRVSELAKEFGLSLQSISPLPGRDDSTAVGFRLELEAPLDRLVQFLLALEYHSPVFAIDQATLRRLNRPGPVTEQPTLFVQLDIIAPVVVDDAKGKT